MLVLDSVDQHSTRAKRRMLLFVQHTAENQGCHDIYNPYVIRGQKLPGQGAFIYLLAGF
jgi:hypothetical protein